MSPWTRNQTKDWINQVQLRIEDIDYYLKKTIEWCEYNEVWEDKKVLMLSILTVIWVCYMRQEKISYFELLEILNLGEMIVGEDKLYSLGDDYINLTHDQLLETAAKNFDADDYFPS